MSSSNAALPRYGALAEQLGTLVAQQAGTLVYGGAKIGLMGAVARAVHSAGGKVVGVLPRLLLERDIGYIMADELIVTETMRERKATMEARADGFIALPGGFGTLEEVLETATNRLLGFHNKPVALVNAHGFYDSLITQIDRVIEEGFARPNTRNLIFAADTPQAAIDYIRSAPTAPLAPTWG